MLMLILLLLFARLVLHFDVVIVVDGLAYRFVYCIELAAASLLLTTCRVRRLAGRQVGEVQIAVHGERARRVEVVVSARRLRLEQVLLLLLLLLLLVLLLLLLVLLVLLHDGERLEQVVDLAVDLADLRVGLVDLSAQLLATLDEHGEHVARIALEKLVAQLAAHHGRR